MPKVNIKGVDLNYEIAGQGEAVVMLHGSNNSTQAWINQVPILAPKYRVITLDCRGHGKSAAPSREADYSIEIFAGDVLGLLEALQIRKCCLVGHSLGGITAVQFAVEHQHRLAALVLEDTTSGGFIRPPEYAELRPRLDEIARSQGMAAALEYNIAHNPQMAQMLRERPEMKEAMRQRMLMTSVNGYIYVEKAINSWQQVTHRLSEIKVPTLIYRGENDLAFTEATRILQEGIAGSELITVKGVGHSPHEEAPDLFNESLLKFLDRISW